VLCAIINKCLFCPIIGAFQSMINRLFLAIFV
jgi:hypothetical protein